MRQEETDIELSDDMDLQNHAGMWIYSVGKAGAVYATRILEDGTLDGKCAWTYENSDLAVQCSEINFVERMARGSIATICDDETFLNRFIFSLELSESYYTGERVEKKEIKGCDDCGGRNVHEYSIQIEHADEPPDIIKKCSDCGSTERNFGYFG